MRRFDTLPEEREEDLMESSAEFSHGGAAPIKNDDDDTLMEDEDDDDDDKPFVRDESASARIADTSTTEEILQVSNSSPTPLSPIFTPEEITRRFSSSMRLEEDISNKVTITSEFSPSHSPIRPRKFESSLDAASPTEKRSSQPRSSVDSASPDKGSPTRRWSQDRSPTAKETSKMACPAKSTWSAASPVKSGPESPVKSTDSILSKTSPASPPRNFGSSLTGNDETPLTFDDVIRANASVVSPSADIRRGVDRLAEEAEEEESPFSPSKEAFSENRNPSSTVERKDSFFDIDVSLPHRGSRSSASDDEKKSTTTASKPIRTPSFVLDEVPTSIAADKRKVFENGFHSPNGEDRDTSFKSPSVDEDDRRACKNVGIAHLKGVFNGNGKNEDEDQLDHLSLPLSHQRFSSVSSTISQSTTTTFDVTPVTPYGDSSASESENFITPLSQRKFRFETAAAAAEPEGDFASQTTPAKPTVGKLQHSYHPELTTTTTSPVPQRANASESEGRSSGDGTGKRVAGSLASQLSFFEQRSDVTTTTTTPTKMKAETPRRTANKVAGIYAERKPTAATPTVGSVTRDGEDIKKSSIKLSTSTDYPAVDGKIEKSTVNGHVDGDDVRNGGVGHVRDGVEKESILELESEAAVEAKVVGGKVQKLNSSLFKMFENKREEATDVGSNRMSRSVYGGGGARSSSIGRVKSRETSVSKSLDGLSADAVLNGDLVDGAKTEEELRVEEKNNLNDVYNFFEKAAIKEKENGFTQSGVHSAGRKTPPPPRSMTPPRVDERVEALRGSSREEEDEDEESKRHNGDVATLVEEQAAEAKRDLEAAVGFFDSLVSRNNAANRAVERDGDEGRRKNSGGEKSEGWRKSASSNGSMDGRQSYQEDDEDKENHVNGEGEFCLSSVWFFTF